MDGTQFLTVQQAAAHFGVTEKTIRRRIAEGKLTAEKVPTSQGYEWRITVEQDAPAAPEDVSNDLDTTTVQVPGNDTVQVDRSHVQAPRQTEDSSALLQALELANRLQRENERLQDERVQLRDQLTWLHFQLQDAQNQIKQLTMDQEPEHEPEPVEPPQQQAAEPVSRRPWWRRLFADI